jgi:Helicase conserved C-terminal domain
MYYQNPQFSNLQEALHSNSVDLLKALCHLLPKGDVPTRKAELVEHIIQSMQGRSLQKLWTQCDRLQQAAIAEVVHSDSQSFQGHRFRCKYNELPDWGSGHIYSRNYKPSILKLFFYNGTLPLDLKERFKEFVPLPIPTLLTSTETQPTTYTIPNSGRFRSSRRSESESESIPIAIVETESVALSELLILLRLVDMGKISVSDKTFYPSTASLKAIVPLLEQGDYYDQVARFTTPAIWGESDLPDVGGIKSFAWVMLLQAGKLVELSNKRLVLTKAGQKALNDSPAKTIVTLWQRWMKNTLLDELRRIESIKGQTGKGKRGLTAPASRRKVLAEVLSVAPVGQWVAVSDFWNYMIASGTDFEVSRTPQNLSNPSIGILEHAPWMVLQARYGLCLLFEYAATLGMIDVAYVHPADIVLIHNHEYDSSLVLSRYDGLMNFRLTPLGAYCLGLSTDYKPIALMVQSILQVSEDLEIVVTGKLTTADALMLDTFAVRQANTVWQFEQQKMLEAIASGRNVRDWEAFLTARSHGALPRSVQQFLRSSESRANRLQDLGTARLIRCSDPALAALIASDSLTQPFCFIADNPVNTTHGQAHYLVVPSDRETKFRNALKKLGYTLGSL